MGRRELIEIIFALKKREVELQERLEAAEKQLEDRRIRMAETGSIAEAALALNGVFEAAQAAADAYVQSVMAVAREKDETGEVAQNTF